MELRIFTEPQQGATYGQLLALAREAERLGFGAFFRSDHYLVMGDGDGWPGPTDAWTTLAGLARETTSIRLGTLVSSATFRLPGPLAITVAQVDAMSGGRVELGLGTGWFEAEHRAYGIPFPPLGERFERLDEQLTVVTDLWATPRGERFDFAGRHYRLTGSPALPKPVQSPHPPIIVGGAGRVRTPRLAATFAAEYNVPFHRPDDTAASFEYVRRACEATGRDPGSIVMSAAQVVCCAEDGAGLARRAARIGRPAGQLREEGLCGSPAEVVDKLRRFSEMGAGRIYLQVLDLDDLDHVRLLGEEVLPAVAGWTAG
ncbi:MAG: LLM class F420-dependent oxidoreductase [Acidimicrobiales bacterium]